MEIEDGFPSRFVLVNWLILDRCRPITMEQLALKKVVLWKIGVRLSPVAGVPSWERGYFSCLLLLGVYVGCAPTLRRMEYSCKLYLSVTVFQTDGGEIVSTSVSRQMTLFRYCPIIFWRMPVPVLFTEGNRNVVSLKGISSRGFPLWHALLPHVSAGDFSPFCGVHLSTCWRITSVNGWALTVTDEW